MYSEKPKLHQRQKKYSPGNLRTISLDVTPRCNMRCSHCYADTFACAEPVFLDVLKHTFDELYELGVFHYVLQGGEPVCDSDRLEVILSYIHPEETYINVVSNGWEMTPDRICWLKKRKVDKIAFSLDSGLEWEHDEKRRPGSFQRVIKAVGDVLAEGLLASISTVVTRNSLHSEGFNKAYEFSRKMGIRIDVQIAEPVGKWDGRKDLLMRPEDSAYIKRLQMESPILKNGQKAVNRDIFSGKEDHCPAGIEFMAISSDGNVLPCNFLQFSLGNIAERPFKQMREALLSSHWFHGRANCLCGENDDFIDQYIMPNIDKPKPLNAFDVFCLKKEVQHA